jgi:hypothetical protein
MQTLGMLFGGRPFAIADTSTVHALRRSAVVSGCRLSGRLWEPFEAAGAGLQEHRWGDTDVLIFDLSPPRRGRPTLLQGSLDRELAHLAQNEVSGGYIFQSHDHVAAENLQ